MTYMEQMEQDIREYIQDNDIQVTEDNREEIAEQLNDDLFTEDSVTGNASGSYFFSSYKAREQIFSDPDAEGYIQELIEEYGLSAETIADHLFDWEYWDVSIRCYLLGQAIENVLSE